MALDLSLRGLAGRSARRLWVVVGAWALTLVISMALIVILIGDSLITDVGLTGEPESREANELIRERFRVPGESTETEIILAALGFVFAHPEVDTAIVGTQNPAHMASNIEMMERGVDVPAEMVEEVHRRYDELREGWASRS